MVFPLRFLPILANFARIIKNYKGTMEEKIKIQQTGANGMITTITLTDDVEHIDVTFDGQHNVSRLMVKLREKGIMNN